MPPLQSPHQFHRQNLLQRSSNLDLFDAKIRNRILLRALNRIDLPHVAFQCSADSYDGGGGAENFGDVYAIEAAVRSGDERGGQRGWFGLRAEDWIKA